MSQESSGDTYFEVQVDRETVILAAVGLVVLLVIAFYAGRYTASPGPSETDAEAQVAELAPEEEGSPGMELEEVDGEPLFGENSVSVAGAPAIGEVPADPIPDTASERTEDIQPERVTPRVQPNAPATEPAKRPPQTESPAAATSGAAKQGWVVQVAALNTMDDAEELQRRLSAEYPVRILESGGFYKVQVGPFASKELAKDAERKLKRREKLSTWIKRA